MRRTLTRRLLTGGIAVAALVPTLPTTAHAVPVSTAGVVLAAAVEDLYEEKLTVAMKFGLGENPDLPGLSDRDFVMAFWREIKDNPDHLEVRLAAEQAFSSLDRADELCVRFITTEVHAAYDRDVARLKREADDKREREVLRATAAAAVDIVADAELLAGSDTDFIRRIWNLIKDNPDWPKVKAAGSAALAGTAEEQRLFITSGLAALAREDTADRIAADQAQTDTEKADALARAAKQFAANRIGMPVTAELLNLPDRDFVIEVWNFSADGTEVQTAAIATIRSHDPAVWKAFIHTGIHQAKERDIQIALDKQEAEDRRVTEGIRSGALGTGFDNLVTAATQALAAGPDALRRFVTTGQYEVAIDDANRPSGGTWEWRNVNSQKCLGPVNGGTGDGTRLVQTDCGADHQQWIAMRVYNTGGQYRLVNAKDRTKCAGIVGAATGNDAPVEIRTCDGRADQHFYYRTVGDNYVWVNENGHKAITVQNASRDNGAAAITYDVNDKTNQQWYPTSTKLTAGQFLSPTLGLHSRNNHQLWLQRDGNAVVYKSGKAVWATNTTTGVKLVNQRDGNLVLYTAAGKAVWASNTSGNGPSTLWMQEDGNLVLYRNRDSKPIWDTRTAS
ncbi:RICIN domain-containing protein [Actinoplanes sp. NBC_00393]|uniref:RICIN domain-containing protein n=1 Tax=Actinoplanes sp. NBC_00393 TaxID=2975953 RepID=UPI002E23CE4D